MPRSRIRSRSFAGIVGFEIDNDYLDFKEFVFSEKKIKFVVHWNSSEWGIWITENDARPIGPSREYRTELKFFNEDGVEGDPASISFHYEETPGGRGCRVWGEMREAGECYEFDGVLESTRESLVEYWEEQERLSASLESASEDDDEDDVDEGVEEGPESQQGVKRPSAQHAEKWRTAYGAYIGNEFEGDKLGPFSARAKSGSRDDSTRGAAEDIAVEAESSSPAQNQHPSDFDEEPTHQSKISEGTAAIAYKIKSVLEWIFGSSLDSAWIVRTLMGFILVYAATSALSLVLKLLY
jgi:hypothetical protein